MTKAEPGAAPAYIAFISYSREDEAFARQLETEIESWPRPAGEAPVRVFRDRSDFTGSAYESALEEHLRHSAALVVLCSPAARRSAFVGDEIARFARLHDAGRIFPILVDGLPDNEAEARRAFPAALLEATRERGMPLGAEFRGIDLRRERLSGGRFESEWYKLLGNLFDKPPAQIREQDQRRLARVQRRRAAMGAAVVALLLVVLALVVWLWMRAEAATHRADEATARAETLAALNQRARAAAEPEPAGAAPAAAGEPAGGAEPAPRAAPAPAPAPPPAPPTAVQPPTAAPQAPATSSAAAPARVYFHIRNEAQRVDARRLASALERAGATVPGIQQIDLGPTQSSELRYFRDAERDEAERIGQALRDAGAGDLRVKKVAGYENSSRLPAHQFELWLKPAGAAAP